MTERKISLKLSTETPGAERVAALAAELDRLADRGGKGAPVFARLAASLRAIQGPAGNAEGAFGRMRQSLAGLAAEAGKLPALLGRISGFLGIGGAGIAGGALALAKGAANAADEMGKLAQRTGLTTEALSRLNYAVSLNDATVGDLEMGIKNLSEKMVDAARGGAESSAAFARLGIAVKNADGSLRGADAVFADLADRFAEMPDGAEKTAAATDLLSRAGLKLIPTLNNGSAGLKAMADEADRFGKTISQEAAARAAEFNDNLVRLQTLAEGVRNSIGNALIPALNALAEEFLHASGAGLSFMEALVGIGLSNPFKAVEEQIEGLIADIERLENGRWFEQSLFGALARDKTLELKRKELAYWRLQLQADERRQNAEADRQAKADSDRAKSVAMERTRIEQQLAAAQTRLSKATADALLRDDKARTDEQIRNANRLKAEYKKAWDEVVAGARRAGQEAASLFAAAANAQQSRQSQAQERRERGMSPEERDANARRRARELTEEASRLATIAQVAAIDGRADRAQQAAKKALELSQEAARYADQIDDDSAAARLIERIGAAEKDALQAQGRLKQQEQARLEQDGEAQLEKIRAIEAELEKIKQTEVKVDVEADAARAEVLALQQQLDALKDKTVTVTLKRVGAAPGTGEGGTESAPGRAYGGPLPGRAYSDRSDNMLYWGTPGEWVIQRPAVRKWGRANMRRINAGQMPIPGYAYGGQLSMSSRASLPTMAAASAAGGSGTPVVLDFGQLGRYSTSAAPDVAGEIVRVFERAALQRGRRK